MMFQEIYASFFQWSPLSLGDIGTITVALATVITLLVSTRLAGKSYRLTVTQINREDKAKVYATALAGLRATYIVEFWDVFERANKIMEAKQLGPYPVALTLSNVFGSGNKRTFYRKPKDDANVNEIRSVEFQVKIDLIGSVEVSNVFRSCIQTYQKHSEDIGSLFWNIKDKETKKDLEAVREISGDRLLEIYKQFTYLEGLMKSELLVQGKKFWFKKNLKTG